MTDKRPGATEAEKVLLQDTFLAILVCLDNLPRGFFTEDFFCQTGERAWEIAWRHLPGGRVADKTGMAAGWLAVGEWIDGQDSHTSVTLQRLRAALDKRKEG